MLQNNYNCFNKSLFLLYVCITIAVTVNAQNLPNIQKNSLRAPSDIQTNGTLKEWHYGFQAFNHSTELFYTIANDDENLYLDIMAAEPQVIKKIIMGGISFTINTSVKKNDKNTILLSFPYLQRQSIVKIVPNLKQRPIGNPDTALYARQLSFFAHQVNKSMLPELKEIYVKGIKEISDSTISIYNNYNIKVLSLFNKQGNYIYQLVLPIKQLNLSDDPAIKLFYSLKVNAVSMSALGTGTISGINAIKVTQGVVTVSGPGQSEFDFLTTVTNCGGEYILVRK